MKPDAKWTDDCMGKQDYDAHIISLSTRYWPQGGGFMAFDTTTGSFMENEDRPEIRPSANAKFILHCADNKDVTLATVDIEGETEEQVKSQVEAWVNNQYQRIAGALLGKRGLFPKAITHVAGY